MDKSWRLVERSCIVLGLLIAAATLYYTAAAYYRENPQQVGLAMSAPGWVFLTGALSIGLLLTGWAMMLLRSKKPKPIPTSLRLQFIADDLNPRCLDIHNIAGWYSMRHGLTVVQMPLRQGSKQTPQAQQNEVRFWTLHIVFEHPSAIKQFLFDGNGAHLPQIEVKHATPLHAVILISGDMPSCILDMRAVI